MTNTKDKLTEIINENEIPSNISGNIACTNIENGGDKLKSGIINFFKRKKGLI